jgi:hypothetical protein
MFLTDFHSVGTAFMTLLFWLIGVSDYAALQQWQPVLTPVFFWSFFAIEFCIVVNFFIAILSDGFSQVRSTHNIPPLDHALRRVFEELSQMLRWPYLREQVLHIAGSHQRVEQLLAVHQCLDEHLRLSMDATEDIGTRRESIMMSFRDLLWWVPQEVIDALGMQFLLVLWEGIVYSFTVIETSSCRYRSMRDFSEMVRKGAERTLGAVPDVMMLEVQAEGIVEKLEDLPRRIAEFGLAYEQKMRLNAGNRKRRVPNARDEGHEPHEPKRGNQELQDLLRDLAKPMC